MVIAALNSYTDVYCIFTCPDFKNDVFCPRPCQAIVITIINSVTARNQMGRLIRLNQGNIIIKRTFFFFYLLLAQLVQEPKTDRRD